MNLKSCGEIWRAKLLEGIKGTDLFWWFLFWELFLGQGQGIIALPLHLICCSAKREGKREEKRGQIYFIGSWFRAVLGRGEACLAHAENCTGLVRVGFVGAGLKPAPYKIHF